MITRRRLGLSLSASALLLGLTPQSAWAQGDDDDDDQPVNVFISPCGQPFRVKLSEPYPVVLWFKQVDKNGDGKIDRAEFVADAEAFFKILDVNGDGVLESPEIARYERAIAPEILGYRVRVAWPRPVPGLYGGRLWRVQSPSGYDNPPDPDVRPPHDLDETAAGASPYGFFSEPEPVMAADENLNGIIRKAAFLRLANRHFDRLDHDNLGYLTLAGLPKTAQQLKVEKAQGRRRR